MNNTGRFYKVHIGEVTRDLPLFNVAPNITIALFNMLGDTEVVEEAAKQLAAKMPAETDVLIIPEVKAVPLGHALSVHSGLPYVVARKVRKPYMENCLEVEVLSITTGTPQTLYIDGKDLHLIQGKNAALVDDVISTGGTLKGLHLLMQQADANVVAEVAVFTEGDESAWSHVLSLGHLPIFTN